METALDTSLGLIGGFVLSFISWWILTHLLVPTLSFSTAISKRSSSNGNRMHYRIKIKNTGKRDIIDISVSVRVYLPGRTVVRRPLLTNVNIVPVPIGTDHLFVLGRDNSRIFRLELDKVNSKYVNSLVATAFRQGSDDALEGLLAQAPNSYLVVEALAFDRWSGARKYYRSQHYDASAIKVGYFDGLNVVSTKPPLQQRDGDVDTLLDDEPVTSEQPISSQ